MSSPFLAEVRIFPFSFAPYGWALCAGQIMSISQNTALFALLGTQFGGDGRVTFGLPNLQNNAPLGQDQSSGGGQYPIGSQSGEPYLTLLTSEMPAHAHNVHPAEALGIANASTPSTSSGLAASSGGQVYADSTVSRPIVEMFPGQLYVTGGSQPHNNMQPYLVLNFCIALQGIFPQRP